VVKARNLPALGVEEDVLSRGVAARSEDVSVAIACGNSNVLAPHALPGAARMSSTRAEEAGPH
jgi:hypothetical protein